MEIKFKYFPKASLTATKIMTKGFPEKFLLIKFF